MRPGGISGVELMDLQSKSNGSGESEALERLDLPVFNGHRPVGPSFAEEESPVLHYWRIISKRRWAVVATVIVVFALSVIMTLKATRLYQATSKVAIFP